MAWEAAVTNFVHSLIKELDWADREYVSDLVQIESLVLRGGPKCLAEGLAYSALRKRYPIAFRRIQVELEQARKSDPEAYRKMLIQREAGCRIAAAREEAYRSAAAELERRKEEEERQLWLAAGGH